MTGVVADSDQRYPMTAVIDQIAKAVKSDKALPPDAEGEALLNAAIRNAATEKPTRVWPASPLAQTISGKTWRFDDNALLVRTLRLNLTADDPIFEFSVYSAKENGRNTIISEPIEGRTNTRTSAPTTDSASCMRRSVWRNSPDWTISWNCSVAIKPFSKKGLRDLAVLSFGPCPIQRVIRPPF